MKSITRTAYGAYLNNCLLQGLPFKVIPNTTLNEKLGINKQQSLGLPQDHYPQLRYLCIGNKGHRVELSNTIPKIKPVQHHSTDAAPFGMIPFVLRELDNDIPPGTREKYALRRQETYNGQDYIAYYLKRFDFSKSKVEMWLSSVENGVKNVIPFVPNASNLNPEPQAIANSGINVVDAKYVEVTNEIEIIFTPEDCEELRHVANVMFNDEELAIISEFGLVSGFDTRMQVSHQGNQITMNEVLAAQMCNVFSTFRSCYIDNLGWRILIKIGSNLPLWFTTQRP